MGGLYYSPRLMSISCTRPCYQRMAFVVMCQDWFFHPSEFFLIKHSEPPYRFRRRK